MTIECRKSRLKMIMSIFLITFIISCGGGSVDVQPFYSDHSNVLVNWASKRTATLVKKGKTESQAMLQAENELANIFGIKYIHKLDITQHETHPHDNALLLLLTGALQEVANNQSIEPQLIISDIALDFSDDGLLTEKGDDWLLHMQALIRDNPRKHLDLYAKSNKSSEAPTGELLPLLIPLASRPSAIAPEEIFAEPGETIILDGSASNDGNHGTIINYTWFRIDQRKQFVVPLSDRFSDSPSITVPNQETELLFALVVTDEQKLTDTTVVKVIIRKPKPKNNPPVADSQSVETDEDLPVNIRLTGSDADNDPINFVIDTPILLPHGILDGVAPNLTYTPTKDFFGSDSFTFKVNDGSEDSLSAIVGITVNPVNDPPVADAGIPETVKEEVMVSLSGTGIDIEDGENVSYQWTAPSGIALIDSTTPTPHFTSPLVDVDSPRELTFTLVVHDTEGLESEPSTVIITVSHENIAPVADAGDPQTVLEQTRVTLHGSGTDQEDGSNVSYQWEPLQGNGFVLDNPNSATPSFISPSVVGEPKVLDFTLRVTDSKGLVSSPDTVKITVTKENRPPVANAGFSKTVIEKTLVFLNGSGTDPEDGTNVSYEWKAPSGIFLFNANTSRPSFVAPEIIGESPKALIFTLIVKDSQKLASEPKSVRITVKKANTPPVANAGIDQIAFEGDEVTLNGQAYDKEDGNNVTFSWINLNNSIVLKKVSTLNPTFTASNIDELPKNLFFYLIVRDREGLVSTDEVVITIKQKINQPPVANAGVDQSGLVGDTITLDGSASSDADGDTLTYAWSLTSIPVNSTATLSTPDSVQSGFTIDMPGTYIAQLIVNDGQVDSIADTITISTLNSKPVANAGVDQSGLVGDTIILDGSASSDADGDTLTYAWSLTNIPVDSTATLSTPDSVQSGFTIDMPGTYIAQLIVNDGQVDSIADTITISTLNSKPVANAGVDQSGLVGDTITLDGSASSDADGDTLTYAWSLTSIPVDSTATLSTPDSVQSGFTIDMPGTYIAQLIVNDGQVDSIADTVTIITLNSQPIAVAKISSPSGEIHKGDGVFLSGYDSYDPDGDLITYHWSLLAPNGSEVTLSNPETVEASFHPSQYGKYKARLIVNDGTVDSDSSYIDILVVNQAPVANAGSDQHVILYYTTSVTLDGSASKDDDGDTLTYTWSFTQKPAYSSVVLSDSAAINPTFTPDEEGEYIIQLIVNDGTEDSDPSSVSVTASY